ncbi:MAG TPA: hypothetical protein VET89_03630 [Stellaceae bacterium]|jgi:hypothetical protein|nr:hypothetical protein [Stellaceae bacterium]
MARVFIADDFDAIRARMAEIRHERSGTPTKKADKDGEPRPAGIHSTVGRRLLKDLVMSRRLRGGGKIALSLAEF